MKLFVFLVTSFWLCVVLLPGCGSSDDAAEESAAPNRPPSVTPDDGESSRSIPPPPPDGFESADALLAYIKTMPTEFDAFQQWAGITHATTTLSGRQVSTLVRLMDATAKVDAAVQMKFGAGVATDNEFARDFPDYSSATISGLTDDRAVLVYTNKAGAGESDVLVRVNGRWLISADELGGGMQDRLAKVESSLAILESIASDVARQVRIGRIASAERAWERFAFGLANARGG